MKTDNVTLTREHIPADSHAGADRRRLAWLAGSAVVLTLAYVQPLAEWAGRAAGSTMYSLVFLVPFISAYLIRERRAEVPRPFRTSAMAGWLGIAAGAILLGWYATLPTAAAHPHDRLAMVLGSFLCFVVGAACFCLGTAVMRALLFPVVFLVFILPMPTYLEHLLEVFFQYTSAEAAALFFDLTGTSVFRDGLVFQLPGITLQVAQECSGINSSYVLFITSLIAGHLFLRKPWKRVVLTLFVVPLAILRNGFRIVTIGLLCVHVSPDMIHSIIHKKGGPIFFALSLIPFFILLLWMRKVETTGGKCAAPGARR